MRQPDPPGYREPSPPSVAPPWNPRAVRAFRSSLTSVLLVPLVLGLLMVSGRGSPTPRR